jgi:hypothetical protein
VYHYRVVAAVLLSAVGCGRLGFETGADPVDGNRTSRDGNTNIDADNRVADSNPLNPLVDGATIMGVGCNTGEVGGGLTNNYDSGTASGLTVSSQGAGQTEFSGGVVKLIPGASATPASVTVVSATDDFTQRRIYTEVPMMVNTGLAVVASFGFNDPGNGSFVRFEQTLGTLTVRYGVPGIEFSLWSRPYDPVAQRWWQIRTISGNTYFEFSADGTNWVDPLNTSNNLFGFLPTSRLEFSAGTKTLINGTMGEVHFDNTFDYKTL